MDNPPEHAERLLDEECQECPKGEVIDNPVLIKLLKYMAMIDAGCPVGRYELSNAEWCLITELKVEELNIIKEKNKKKKAAEGAEE